MKCHYCDNPATVHLTDIISKKKRERHLCENCAREHNLFPDPKQELDIPALLQFLVDQTAAETAKTGATDTTCPHCGVKYSQFRAQGRLGCPEDYEVFRTALEPLLERIHHHTRHCGKIPVRFRTKRREWDRDELLRHIQDAVREERYEEAARLRDQIRSMGTADESR